MIRKLGKLGFEVARVKGSHHFLKSDDGRATVVPVPRGEILGPGLLSKISKNAEPTDHDVT
ncbi:MAG: type II toxin-antitoxin system HicA family toxin [Verrucomicrobia bacterium]|nr:type II toxin-antitoxin system HicA family toxin [Verrucomicrobiota bacterium]